MQDLSNQVTAFVLTVGSEENFRECMAHLERQSVRFAVDVIDHVAPLSAALQEMIHRCRTRYYVEVDEDMMLAPDAIEKLNKLITEDWPEAAAVVAPLWDCDIGRSLYGLKIHRHEVVKRFSYRDTHSSDKDLSARLRVAGHDVVNLPLGDRESCFGEHGRHYTPRTIFLRWKRLFEKRRLDGEHRGRGIPPPSFFLERYLRDPHPLHLHSLLGVVAALTGEPPPDREIDYRDACPDFERLAKAFGPPPESE
jgi:hypothetical protein